MHIPRVVAAVLAVRQLGTLLPADYCTPECRELPVFLPVFSSVQYQLERQLTIPKASCKAGIVNFDSTTECVSNSSFLTNCGACQTCVQTYAIENPNTPDAALLEADIAKIINACADSPASTQVEALQSQASRISLLASMLVTTTASPTTSISHAITPAPTGTWTGTHSWSTSDWDNESWTSILATASWAPYYYSRVSRGQNHFHGLETLLLTTSRICISGVRGLCGICLCCSKYDSVSNFGSDDNFTDKLSLRRLEPIIESIMDNRAGNWIYPWRVYCLHSSLLHATEAEKRC